MGIEVLIGATVASALISAGTSAYQTDQQKSAAKKDRETRMSMDLAAKAKAKNIADRTKQEQETVQEIDFGQGGAEEGLMGSAQDFLVPKTSALGSSSASTGRSGLGFSV